MQVKLSCGQDILSLRFPDTDRIDVRHVMESLKNTHKGLYERWCDANGNIRETLTVFVNGDHIRYQNGLETVIEEDDEIYIVPLITGG